MNDYAINRPDKNPFQRDRLSTKKIKTMSTNTIKGTFLLTNLDDPNIHTGNKKDKNRGKENTVPI